MKMNVPALLLICVVTCAVSAQGKVNPYACEGIARDGSRNASIAEIRAKADDLSKSTNSVELCTAAELYKRIGDARAPYRYREAIQSDESDAKSLPEPVYELLYGDYLRLYRGAGQRPLFPEAEKHLLRARSKLSALMKSTQTTAWPECSPQAWNKCTEDRIQRSLTALYERDGVPLANRKAGVAPSEVSQPWLFYSPSARLAWASDDFDQPSDVRDLTSAALFSQNCLPNPVGRLCRALSKGELAGMVRVVTPMEVSNTLRIRYGSAPVVDILASARRTGDGAINSSTGFFTPDNFTDLKLLDFGVQIEKPFAICGITDGDLQFSFNHINRQGLIEFQPDAQERIDQYKVYGSLSHYLGPDRINLSYTFVRQNIDPTPYLARRDRELMGGTVDYQLFRPLPLPGRDVNTGLGRHFETRGIDLIAGFLNDHDHYADPYGDVIIRQDYFVGVTGRGFGRIDATIQPTLYSSRVSNDPTQSNSQFRIAGNVLVRILDEERTSGIPSQRFLGMPVGFVQVVLPFHWDLPRDGLASFQSRAVGAELSTKVFTSRQVGVTILGVAGYSRDWFPILNRDLNLGRVGLSIGF